MDLWLSKRISWQQLHHSQVMGCLVVWLGGCCQQNIPITLPETNVAPENRPLEVWRFLVETTIFLELFCCGDFLRIGIFMGSHWIHHSSPSNHH